MGSFLRRHSESVLVAMITAALATAGPAIGHGVEHALFSHDSARLNGNTVQDLLASPGAVDLKIKQFTTDEAPLASGQVSHFVVKVKNVGAKPARNVTVTTESNNDHAFEEAGSAAPNATCFAIPDEPAGACAIPVIGADKVVSVTFDFVTPFDCGTGQSGTHSWSVVATADPDFDVVPENDFMSTTRDCSSSDGG